MAESSVLDRAISTIYNLAGVAVPTERYFDGLMPGESKMLGELLEELKSAKPNTQVGGKIIAVGGSVNRPGVPHKDLDIKVLVEAGHSADVVNEKVRLAIDRLVKSGSFGFKEKDERTNLTESRKRPTWVLFPLDEHGEPVKNSTHLQVIPHLGREETPAHIELTSDKGPNKKFTVLIDEF